MNDLSMFGTPPSRVVFCEDGEIEAVIFDRPDSASLVFMPFDETLGIGVVITSLDDVLEDEGVERLGDGTLVVIVF